jgi:uncharacterized protein
MNNALIDKIAAIVEEACTLETNIYGYGIWSHHIKPMLPISRDLAEIMGADLEIVTIAALLHDYAGIINKDNHVNHHILGAKAASQILNKENYSQDKIVQIMNCIENHRSSVVMSKNSKEEICVADADAIVHIDQIESLFYVVYKQMDLSIDDGKNWITEKINRDWMKLSETGKEYIQDKYEHVLGILEKR